MLASPGNLRFWIRSVALHASRYRWDTMTLAAKRMLSTYRRLLACRLSGQYCLAVRGFAVLW
jgi:hypothetical protein